MSAARGDNTKKQNQAASDKLVKRIKGAGLPGPKKVSGVYHEKDHGEQKEKSFIVSSGKQGKKRFKKTMQKLGQAGGLKQKRNQPADSKKKDQDSILIKQKKGTSGKASWLGTSRRKDADPKLGKKYDQGKMNTKMLVVKSNQAKVLPELAKRTYNSSDVKFDKKYGQTFDL